MQATRQQILDHLHQQPSAGVKELATLLGITATGIRQHLGVLQREGFVEAREERGHVGRPAYLFRLTDRGRQLYPTRYDELTNMLLEEVRATTGAETYQRVLGRIARRMAAERMDRVEGLPLAERVEVVTDIMREMGCVAESEVRDGEFLIHQCTCPYPNVARRNRAVCALEVEYVRRLTNADARLVASLLRGDRACTYRIRPLTVLNSPTS